MKQIFWYYFFCILTDVAGFILRTVLVFLHGSKGKIVPSADNPLLLKSATQLAQEIRNGELKSEDVVQAYIDRIKEVEPYIHATAEKCFEDALEKAKGVDSLVSSGQYTKQQLADEKPFLGVPISIKALLLVKGVRSTAGYEPYSHLIAPEDAQAVGLLKNAGAIVITTTNVPEMGLNIDTANRLYGATNNPYDTNRSSGGSSGGESALIGAGGSLLGIGNDLLGSVRIPAHFTGIFSHKPTRGLTPNSGCFPPDWLFDEPKLMDPEIYKHVSVGPMCRYAEDLMTSMKILSSKSGTKLNFQKQLDFRKLKIYYLKEIKSPMVPSVEKDIADGLMKAVSYFERVYDIKPREVKIPSLYDSNRCVFNILLETIKDFKDLLTCGKGLPFNEKLDFLKCFIGKSQLCFGTLFTFNFAFFPLWYKKPK